MVEISEEEADAQDDVITDNYTAAMKSNQTQKHPYFLRTKTQPRSIEEMDKERLSMMSSSSSYSNNNVSSEEEDLANCLVMLSNKSDRNLSSDGYGGKEQDKAKETASLEKNMFQCKACKKVFNSHQALGGHRASHKKVKGCFAARSDGLDYESSIVDHDPIPDEPLIAPPAAAATSSGGRRRAKMHECSVCRRVFSSGQALGGHKRCHWLTTSSDNAFIPNFHDFQYHHHLQSQQLCKKPMMMMMMTDGRDRDRQLDLNLNLPAATHVQDNKTMSKSETTTTTTRSCVEEDKIEGPGEEMKLSELRDVNLDGGWLQMGIASNR